MHQREANNRAEIQRLPSELFAEGRSHEWDDTESESVHGQTDDGLEPGAVQVPRHGVETESISRSVSSCGRKNMSVDYVEACWDSSLT